MPRSGVVFEEGYSPQRENKERSPERKEQAEGFHFLNFQAVSLAAFLQRIAMCPPSGGKSLSPKPMSLCAVIFGERFSRK